MAASRPHGSLFCRCRPPSPLLQRPQLLGVFVAGLVVGGKGSGDGRERNACGDRISISGGLGQLTGGGSVVQAHKAMVDSASSIGLNGHIDGNLLDDGFALLANDADAVDVLGDDLDGGLRLTLADGGGLQALLLDGSVPLGLNVARALDPAEPDQRDRQRSQGQQAVRPRDQTHGAASPTHWRYRRYAIEANQGTTNLATFRAIAKKYPSTPPEQILRDLVASTPGAEGKWFAAAKDAGLFNVAIELATTSPTDPRTLARAARDFAESQPEFAVAAGLASLRWISLGHGFEIIGTDVLDAYAAVMKAASTASVDAQQIKTRIRELLTSTPTGSQLMKTVLAHHLFEQIQRAAAVEPRR